MLYLGSLSFVTLFIIKLLKKTEFNFESNIVQYIALCIYNVSRLYFVSQL